MSIGIDLPAWAADRKKVRSELIKVAAELLRQRFVEGVPGSLDEPITLLAVRIKDVADSLCTEDKRAE